MSRSSKRAELPTGRVDLRELLGVPFTDEQLAAITAPLEPGVIVAGAGSGKTTVMAARVVWLVANGLVSPDAVLGLTFTNKAAGELAHRVRTVLRTAARAGLVHGALHGEVDAEPSVSTYHAFAQQLIVDHGLRIGVEPTARLLADASRFQLAHLVLRGAAGPIEYLTKPLHMLVADLVALDGELNEHLCSVADLRAHDELVIKTVEAAAKPGKDAVAAADVARRRIELAALVDEYRAAKSSRDEVDFGDQMALAARLAETRPEVGEIERDRYRVVLLDEYQDTSVAQRRMLAALFGGGHPVTAVGDPCQAIYGWRGASVANLDEFPRHFPRSDSRPAVRYTLRQNRRSGGRLLGLTNEVSAPLRRLHEVDALTACPGRQDAGDTVCALLATYADEMRWVADRVRAAVDEGTSPGQVAVLVRARADFPALFEALTAVDLPVEVVGLGGLVTLPEVADVVATLQVLDDPTSNAALVRLLAGPRWRIGPRDLVLLGRRARTLAGLPLASHADDPFEGDDQDSQLDRAVSGNDPTEVDALADALDHPGPLPYSDDARSRFAALSAELRQLRHHVDEPLPDLVHRIVATTGLDVELAASPQAVAAGRRESLSAFCGHAASFTDLDGDASVGGFLAFLRAAQEYERGLDTTVPSGADTVKLLTVHKAKGLEWDVVAVPNVTERVFPSSLGRPRWTTQGQVLPFGLRGDADSLPAVSEWSAKGLRAFSDACREQAMSEERRLCYVAFTRARHRLLVSGHWWGPTQKVPRGPSPFLREARDHAQTAAEHRTSGQSHRGRGTGGTGRPRRGNGQVDVWVDEPPGEQNPQLQRDDEQVRWPHVLDEQALQARREVADLVTAAMAGHAEPAQDEPSSPLTTPPSTPADETARMAGWDADAQALLDELHRERHLDHEVELPASLSASQLVRLARDPSGLAADLARPMPRPPAPRARRGTRFHAWVETQLAQQPLLEPESLPGAGDEHIRDEQALAELKQAFADSEYAHRTPVAVEAPFQLVLGGHVLRGRIDAVYRAESGYEVVDWKTGDGPADPIQLAVYRVAWADLAGVPDERVSATFFYVREGRAGRPDDLPDRDALLRLLA